MNTIVGLLLAAGSSCRFGDDKRWHGLPDGTPMALAAARHLRAACQRSIAIVRPGDDKLASLFSEAGLEVTSCPSAALGMGHSLAAGVQASPTAAGWLVALADMPLIAAQSYETVLTALAAGAPLARTAFSGNPGHPVGFSARFREDLLALHSDEGGKAIINANRNLLITCPVDDPGVLIDIDTPQDERKHFERVGDFFP